MLSNIFFFVSFFSLPFFQFCWNLGRVNMQSKLCDTMLLGFGDRCPLSVRPGFFQCPVVRGYVGAES